MRILLDTNVVLDLLLERDPFTEHATVLFSLIDCGKLEAYVSAISVTTVHYIAAKHTTKVKARNLVQLLLRIVEVAPVNDAVLSAALDLGFSDFEDAVIHESAKTIQAQAIVTRNIKDFRKASLAVLKPDDFLKAYLSRALD